MKHRRIKFIQTLHRLKMQLTYPEYAAFLKLNKITKQFQSNEKVKFLYNLGWNWKRILQDVTLNRLMACGPRATVAISCFGEVLGCGHGMHPDYLTNPWHSGDSYKMQ